MLLRRIWWQAVPESSWYLHTILLCFVGAVYRNDVFLRCVLTRRWGSNVFLQGLLTPACGNVVFSRSKMHAYHKRLVFVRQSVADIRWFLRAVYGNAVFLRCLLTSVWCLIHFYVICWKPFMEMSCFLIQECTHVTKVSCFPVYFCSQLLTIECVPCLFCTFCTSVCDFVLMWCSLWQAVPKSSWWLDAFVIGFAESRSWEWRVFSLKIARA